ncbi:hypothetical protein BDFB_006405, partial [Asbolus verrucosus]
MSPNGHTINTETIPEPPPQKESIWSLNRSSKDLIKNNNTNLLRRSSMNEKLNKKSQIYDKKCDEKEDLKKTSLVLPDVLPVNAKMLSTRSQYNRPTNLNLTSVENASFLPHENTTERFSFYPTPFNEFIQSTPSGFLYQFFVYYVTQADFAKRIVTFVQNQTNSVSKFTLEIITIEKFTSVDC